jgi:hypothetical protein
MDRDAGRFFFEGSFRRGEGAGHFTFTPRPEFVAAMQQLGYPGLGDEKIYSMAVLDVSRAFVKQLDALGYSRLDLDELLSLRIHGADQTFIRAMKALGYDHLAADELVHRGCRADDRARRRRHDRDVQRRRRGAAAPVALCGSRPPGDGLGQPARRPRERRLMA